MNHGNVVCEVRFTRKPTYRDRGVRYLVYLDDVLVGYRMQPGSTVTTQVPHGPHTISIMFEPGRKKLEVRVNISGSISYELRPRTLVWPPGGGTPALFDTRNRKAVSGYVTRVPRARRVDRGSRPRHSRGA